MFFEIPLKRLVVLKPHQLQTGVYLHIELVNQILEDVKCLKCNEDHGYYITPTTLQNIGEGKVRCHTGTVVFPVEFKCIVFKPIVGEVLECEVKQVLRRGCLLSCGPLEEIFLHVEAMKGFVYETCEGDAFGMFKDASGKEIKLHSVVRLRILGLKWVEELRSFRALGTINGHYLGCIEVQPGCYLEN